MEAIIESVDEFYSENLAQEVTRGMREAAARGFWMASRAPYGYTRVLVPDGAKERPKLAVAEPAAGVVRRLFALADRGQSLLDITKTLNAEGIASPTGQRWLKTTVQKILTNEVYTGTLVWGANAKDQAPPVRVPERPFPPSSPRRSSGGWPPCWRLAGRPRCIPGGRPAPTCSVGWSSAGAVGGRSPGRRPSGGSSPTTSASRCCTGGAGPVMRRG